MMIAILVLQIVTLLVFAAQSVAGVLMLRRTERRAKHDQEEHEKRMASIQQLAEDEIAGIAGAPRERPRIVRP